MRLKTQRSVAADRKSPRHRMNRIGSRFHASFVAASGEAIPSNAQHGGAAIIQTIRTPKL
jgi:hypothetical protein